MNINALTKEQYTKGNDLKLNIAKASEGWTSNKWLTFLQARKLHLKIKKGAKATLILIPAGHAKTTDADGNEQEDENKQVFKRCYVFNLDQTEKTNAEKKAEAERQQQPELPTQAEEPKAEQRTEAKTPAPKPAKTEKATPDTEQKAEADSLIRQLQNRFKRAV